MTPQHRYNFQDLGDSAIPDHPPIEQGTVPPANTELGDNLGARLLIPVGRSSWAIAAGYLGLFSVTFVFAPFAVIVAIIAIVDIRRHPKRHGMGRAIFGLVMGLLFCGIGLWGGIASLMEK